MTLCMRTHADMVRVEEEGGFSCQLRTFLAAQDYCKLKSKRRGRDGRQALPTEQELLLESQRRSKLCTLAWGCLQRGLMASAHLCAFRLFELLARSVPQKQHQH